MADEVSILNSWNDVKNAVMAKFTEDINAVYSIPIMYKNVPFKRDDRDEFIELGVIPTTTEQETYDNEPIFFRNGDVILKLYTKMNAGTNAPYIILDYILDIYNNLEHKGVYFGPESVTEVGNIDLKWFQINIIIPFHYQK